MDTNVTPIETRTNGFKFLTDRTVDLRLGSNTEHLATEMGVDEGTIPNGGNRTEERSLHFFCDDPVVRTKLPRRVAPDSPMHRSLHRQFSLFEALQSGPNLVGRFRRLLNCCHRRGVSSPVDETRLFALCRGRRGSERNTAVTTGETDDKRYIHRETSCMGQKGRLPVVPDMRNECIHLNDAVPRRENQLHAPQTSGARMSGSQLFRVSGT